MACRQSARVNGLFRADYFLFALDVRAYGTIERWIANTDMVPVD
jgi:hypothetical protein